MRKNRFCLVFVLLATLTASLAFAGEARLVQLDNSMVKDTKTGLIWQFDKSPEKLRHPMQTMPNTLDHPQEATDENTIRASSPSYPDAALRAAGHVQRRQV